MQKLVPLLEQLSGTIGQLRVDRLTVLATDKKDGLGGGSLAGKLVGYSEQIKAATGVDVPKLLQDRLGESAPAPAQNSAKTSTG
jgi:flotillin